MPAPEWSEKDQAYIKTEVTGVVYHDTVEDLVHGRSLPKPERKTALTFQEKITAAHLHYVQGIDQHVIAFAMGVNSGRVNEACRAIRRAIEEMR